MKRPALVVAVNVLQVLLGLLLAGISVYLLILTRSPKELSQPDAADGTHGLLVGAIVLGIPAVITLIAAIGLWKGRFWGWLLSLATDIGLVGALIYAIIDDYEFDPALVAPTVIFIVPVVLLLLPSVRRAYWNKADARNVAAAN